MYRYRPIGSLLQYKELENSEIYFASPHELNDPIEGMMDVVWQGDKVVWRNLLKHYLLCLEQMCCMAMLYKDERDEIKEYISLDIPIYRRESTLPTEEYKEIFAEIKHKFFSLDIVLQTIDILCYEQRSVRRNELSLALLALQRPALKCIFEVYIARKLHPDNEIIEIFNEPNKTDGYLASYMNMIKSNSNTVEQNDMLFSIYKKSMDEIKLLALVNLDEDNIYNKLGFLVHDFTDKYLSNLLELAYPKWYTACFSATCTDATMWANYAGNHRGVCLKFKPVAKCGGISLPLYMQTGFRAAMGVAEKVYDWPALSLEKVIYTNDLTQLDFFKSLLTLPIQQIYDDWYVDQSDSSVSGCAEVLPLIDDETTGLRLKYWKDFNAITVSKSIDWEKEQEYRLVISNVFHDYTDASSRVFKYKFENLEGVVFGVNTTFEDKLKIVKIISGLCREHNRYDFDFYQMSYKGNNKEMVVDKLRLLKFKADAFST